MNKKQKMWLALLCLLFWTCTDLSPFGDSEELVQDSDPALVKLAKEMLQRSKYELSLPDIHKHHSGSASTRSLKYDTDVSPPCGIKRVLINMVRVKLYWSLCVVLMRFARA